MASDMQDKFRVSCANAQDYPRNLIDIDRSGPSFVTTMEELKKEKDNVWDPTTAELMLLELYDGDEVCERPRIDDEAELLGHLSRNRKDPRFRFVFLEAEHSRAPLNCSADMFNVLATHHQVSPAFTSNILSFGEQELPRDFSLMTFQSEDNLYARESDVVSLPHLGRSGRHIRYCFNIRTVEPSSSEPGWGWSMRNLAMYHTFDVETGRTLWLTLKANDLITNRIYHAVKKPLFCATSQATMDGSFASTLEILWIVMDWSDENWRPYINNLDEELRKIVIKAKTAQIDRNAKMPEELIRTLKHRATARSMESPPRASTLTEKMQGGVNALIKTLPMKKTPEKTASDDDTDPEGDQRALHNLSVLNTFTFAELQRLHIIGERINEAVLVVGLTNQIVQSVQEYYSAMFKSEALPKTIRDGCQPDMSLFLQRMANIERNLQIRGKQLESMARLVQEAKTLFDGILQYRAMQINLLFAQSGYDSNKKMESIAHKTEQETTSMHVITTVTLLFLPGTFVASFFQSGVIQLKVPDTIERDWIMLPGPAGLFFKISLGLMAVVFVIWALAFGYIKHKARQRLSRNRDMV